MAKNLSISSEDINLKTDKLLAFGVEKVIWVISESKKAMIATKDENW